MVVGSTLVVGRSLYCTLRGEGGGGGRPSGDKMLFRMFALKQVDVACSEVANQYLFSFAKQITARNNWKFISQNSSIFLRHEILAPRLAVVCFT